jgi:pilus assembly protein Flp/PilA
VLIKLHVIVTSWFDDLQRREEGQTLVEYGLILALVALVVAAALTGLAGKVSSLISKVGAQL